MSVDREIFAIFQHKVERIPHFARVTEVRHIFLADFPCGQIRNQTLSITADHLKFINGTFNNVHSMDVKIFESADCYVVAYK